MKRRCLNLGAVMLFGILLLGTGCNARSGEDQSMVAADPIAMQPAPPVSQLPVETAAVQANQVAPVPAAGSAMPLVPPLEFTPSKSLADVVKLVRGGVSDHLIRTFITNTQGSFDLGAAGIVYLHDLGLSDEMINLMLEHDHQPLLVPQSTVVVAPPPPPAVVVQETPEVNPPVVVLEEPAPVTVNYFYNTLSPYGNWIEIDGFGRCWQPTIVYAQPDWRPYCDNGHWVYSSCGWYWVSDYSWGVTFHYGRWLNHPRRGWCWAPDTIWGPAWVSWRESADYCGWAPLPPRATWVAGAGLTYGGVAVGVGFDFGLSSHCYTMVPRSHLFDRRPYQYALPHARVTQIFNNTMVINNYSTGDRGRVFNHGLGHRDQISSRDRRGAGGPMQPLSPQAGGPRGRGIDATGSQPTTTTVQLPAGSQSGQMPADQTRRHGNEENQRNRLPNGGANPQPRDRPQPPTQPVVAHNGEDTGNHDSQTPPVRRPGDTSPSPNRYPGGPSQRLPPIADDAHRRILLGDPSPATTPASPVQTPVVIPPVVVSTPTVSRREPIERPQSTLPKPELKDRGTYLSPPYVPPQARIPSRGVEVPPTPANRPVIVTPPATHGPVQTPVAIPPAVVSTPTVPRREPIERPQPALPKPELKDRGTYRSPPIVPPQARIPSRDVEARQFPVNRPVVVAPPVVPVPAQAPVVVRPQPVPAPVPMQPVPSQTRGGRSNQNDNEGNNSPGNSGREGRGNGPRR